jgi:hypothetical protein
MSVAHVNVKEAAGTSPSRSIPSAHVPAVGPAGTAATQAQPPEPVWHESSLDLSIGLDTVEHPLDTLPGDLQDLFRPA